jgi:hypothetical protein
LLISLRAPSGADTETPARSENTLLVLKYLSYFLDLFLPVFVPPPSNPASPQLKHFQSEAFFFNEEVSVAVVRDLFDQLSDEGQTAAAARLYQLFPHKVDAQSLYNLCAVLLQDSDSMPTKQKNMRLLGDLMETAGKAGSNDSSHMRELAVDVLDALLGDFSASRTLGIAVPAQPPFAVRTDEIKPFNFIAMIAIYNAFSYFLTDALREEIYHREGCAKLEALVTSGKWQVAMMKSGCSVQRKSTSLNKRKLQIHLYNVLRQQGLFLEATEVYDLSALHDAHAWSDVSAAARLVPKVTPAELQEQVILNKRTFLQLPLEQPDISVVRNLSSLGKAELDICGPQQKAGTGDGGARKLQFVGMDSEWDFNTTGGGASILQIATAEKVWIFDMTALGRCNPATIAYCREVFCRIFHDPYIIKLGCDFNRSDLGMLQASAGGKFASAFASTRVKGLFEVQALLQGVQVSIGSALSSSADATLDPKEMLSDKVAEESVATSPPAEVDRGTSTKSLKSLCLAYLGRPLNKSCQLSDWNGRLSPSQLEYASLDAHCLLALMDVSLRHYAEYRATNDGARTSLELQLPSQISVLEKYASANNTDIKLQLTKPNSDGDAKEPHIVKLFRNHHAEIESCNSPAAGAAPQSLSLPEKPKAEAVKSVPAAGESARTKIAATLGASHSHFTPAGRGRGGRGRGGRVVPGEGRGWGGGRGRGSGQQAAAGAVAGRGGAL